jgi:ABC-2 type transport system ATP-binding protein
MKTVEIDNLTVKFGNFTAVSGLTMSVEKGEIFGFLGANGAGKTTAIRVMCGLLVPSSGQVRIAGFDLKNCTTAIKQIVGYMSQKFTLYNDLTVIENLNFKAALRKIPDTVAQERIKKIFDFIGFNYGRNVMVRELPTGIKQQLSLAATLLHDPQIIFLDEPTSGVSPSVRARFWSLIRMLSKEGKTVFVTTHYMDEAEECARIALMRSGRLVALDSPENLKKKAYPHGIVEVSFHEHGKINAGAILNTPDIAKYWPFGLKYHAELFKELKLSNLLTQLPAGVNLKEINPSLEDVFMKLIEGEDR